MSKEFYEADVVVDWAMPEVLALVRHGFSEGQAAQERERQGDLSAFTPEFRNTSSMMWNLTRKGVWQARVAAMWLGTHVVGSTIMSEDPFDRGYFSPYRRSRQTMGVFLREGLVKKATVNERLFVANHDIRLREVDFGEASTIPRDEFQKKYPASVQARKIDPIFGRTPGGESIADVVDRSRSFFGALTRAHARGVKTALVVSHGRQIRATQLALEGIDPMDWYEYDRANEIKNCQTVLYSRIDPESGEKKPTYRWTASVCPWETPNHPPQWRKFLAPIAITAEACLDGIPDEWLDGPLADL